MGSRDIYLALSNHHRVTLCYQVVTESPVTLLNTLTRGQSYIYIPTNAYYFHAAAAYLHEMLCLTVLMWYRLTSARG